MSYVQLCQLKRIQIQIWKLITNLNILIYFFLTLPGSQKNISILLYVKVTKK
jgi:hypothetical protein